MSVKRIGVLTSGGDAPGMNPCVRAVVRTALYRGLECYGIRRGWNGLITGDIVRLDEKSVSHTINRGGTILYTARSQEFMTEEGQRRAVSTCKFLGLDSIIAIGGGSSMDCAKAVGARLARPHKSLSKMEGILKIWHRLPLLIAVPTTAGTGSETTLAAVITDADTHHKYAINDFNLIPDYAVLEPSVTYGLPPQLTATTGMDALTHAIEAYIGRSTTKQTRSAAVEAIQLIFANLQNAYNNGNDKTARHHMLRASYLAGTAFTKSYVGYVHAVAHSLGGCYGIPHGLANSVLLPVILEAYGTAAHKKLARLARLTGISDSNLDAVAAGEFIRHIRNMNLSMNIPETLDGIRNEDIPKLARYADKEANPLYPVPVLWGPSKLEQMYHLVQEVNENDRNRNSEHPGKAA